MVEKRHTPKWRISDYDMDKIYSLINTIQHWIPANDRERDWALAMVDKLTYADTYDNANRFNATQIVFYLKKSIVEYRKRIGG